MDGSYPPGVEGWMIDGNADEVELPENCQNCMFYDERSCGNICGILEASWTEEELKAMSDEEYIQRFGKKPDDYCYNFERWED